MVSWRKILVYGGCLFVAQVTIGVLDGFFFPNSGPRLSPGDIGSYAACFLLFSHLASHTKRMLLHAFLALAFYCSLSLAFDAALRPLLGSIPILLLLKEWLVLAVSMLVALGVVYAARHKVSVSHEA